MIKCYRYLIYKLYSWALRRENDTPVFNVMITLIFTHFIQLFTIYMVVVKYVPAISVFSNDRKYYPFIFFLLFAPLNYALLYNKAKWESYLDEFRNEGKNESRRGSVMVLAYLIGSIVLFFATLFVVYVF